MFQINHGAGFGDGHLRYLSEIFVANVQSKGSTSTANQEFSIGSGVTQAQPGDLAIFVDHATNGTTATLPTTRTPSGWTTLGNEARVSSGDYVRTCIHTRIIRTSDLNTKIYGMTTNTVAGSGVLLILRGNRFFTYAGMDYISSNTHVNAPANITLAGTSYAQPMISLGFFSARSGDTATCTMTGTTVTIPSYNTNRLIYRMRDYTETTEDLTLSMTDSGSTNHMVGCIITLR